MFLLLSLPTPLVAQSLRFVLAIPRLYLAYRILELRQRARAIELIDSLLLDLRPPSRATGLTSATAPSAYQRALEPIIYDRSNNFTAKRITRDRGWFHG